MLLGLIREGDGAAITFLKDVGVDLSSPKYKLDDVFKFSAKIIDVPLTSILDAFKHGVKRGRDKIEELFEQIGWDYKATQVYTDQVMKRFA